MHSLEKAIGATALGCVIGLMAGCASSRLVDVWQDPSFQAPPLARVLVIAVRKDATQRRIWEDAFTSQLSNHGVAARSSYSLFADAPPDTNQVIEAVRANGFDGVLAILNLLSETTTHHVRGYTTLEQDRRYPLPGYQSVRYVYQGDPPSGQNIRYISYWERYRTYYREVEHPGYTDTQTVDVRAIDVTTTGKDGRLIWSATSRTADPGSVTDAQRGVVALVMSELAQRGIISAAK